MMSAVEKSKRRKSAAARTLREIEAPVDLTGDQSLHRANSESESQPEVVPPPVKPLPETISFDAGTPDLERKIGELLDQIGEGLRADDATNFEKLTIARKYGPLLWDLKALADYGDFMDKLKDRFPKVSYAKCNRWMFIAKHEDEVAAAIEKYPDVAWGPKKMLDYLKGWNPEEESGEDDEDGSDGFAAADDLTEESPLPFNRTDYASEPDATPQFADGNRKPISAAKAPYRQKQDSLKASKTPATDREAKAPRPRPRQAMAVAGDTVARTEHRFEVRIAITILADDDMPQNEVNEAISNPENWKVELEPGLEYSLSVLSDLTDDIKI